MAEPVVTYVAEPDPALAARLEKLRALIAEAEAVIAHFHERPTVAAEDFTEEDARWIVRYDAARAELRKIGAELRSLGESRCPECEPLLPLAGNG